MRNPDCDRCPLHSNAVTVCLWGEQQYGVEGEHISGKPSDVMVVGEAPGFYEDQEGRPFVGSSGKLLRGALKDVGLTNYYITNAVKCRPPDNKLPDRDKELGQIMVACQDYLYEEIRTVKPKFILALGNTALISLTGMRGITKRRGVPIESNFGYGPVTVLPAYHPAYVLRNPGLSKMFKLDLSTFANMAAGRTGEDFWKPMKVELVTKASQVQAMRDRHKLASTQPDTVQVYDIETLGYWMEVLGKKKISRKYVSAVDCPPELGTIPWLGISYINKSGENIQYVVPWEHPKCPSGWRKGIAKLAADLLTDPDIKHVAQHGTYDDRWMRSRGIIPNRTFDVYHAAFVLDENSPHDLCTIGTMYCGAPTWPEIDYPNLDKLPFKEVADYLGKDLYVTGRAYFVLKDKILQDKGLARVFKHVITAGDAMLSDVQASGLWVHEDVLEEKTLKFIAKRDQAVKDLNKLVGREVNWNSAPQKVKLLFDELQLPVLKRSKKTGEPSTDKDVLAQLEEDTEHLVVVALRKYQKVEMLVRFLKRWRIKLDLAKSVRGEPRLYTELNIAKAATGRLSSSDPDGTGDNLQQIPIRGEGAELREVFGVPEGRNLICADYSQIELRVAADEANEPTMLKLFRAGRDLHTYTAAAVMRKPESEIDKDDRRKAKAVNFGFIYKMRPKRYTRYSLTEFGLACTLEEAKALQRTYFRLYPGMLKYYARIEKEVRSTGQVRSRLGRIRRLPDIYSPDEFVQDEALRKGINAPIQSVASDMTTLAAIWLHENLPPFAANVVLLVHDSIMIECDEEVTDQICEMVKYAMEKIVLQQLKSRFGVTLKVPIVADVEVGKSWGTGKKWEPKKKGAA